MTGWTVHWKTQQAAGRPMTRYCLVALTDPQEALAAVQKEVGDDATLEIGTALTAEQLEHRKMNHGDVLLLGKRL